MQRPPRHLERSPSKRGLDAAAAAAAAAGEPDAKRPRVPALASVIVEALKVDSLQRLCSSLEPILRRVVSEEVERALAKLGPAKLEGTQGRSSPKRIEGPNGRSLQLHFRSRLALPLFTGGKVEGEQGATIHVVLLDANTGRIVTTGPEAFAKLDVLVLEGDFNKESDDDWTEEEFESHVVKEREGKRPLLTGDLQVTLKEGVGTLGELIFTDNSSWIRSRKFRLGLKLAAGICDGTRVREAKTEAFTVKDHRGELYKKHYPPTLKDEVWRLEKIGKDGAFHGRLNNSGIYTVEDFLRLLVRDQQKLRNILGTGMSNKMWEMLVDHAKTCVLGGKHYVYYSDDGRNVGAIFNNIYAFTGLIADGQFYSDESLNESQRLFADALVKKAYDNWMQAVEYDGEALLSFKQKKKSNSTRNGPSTSKSYPPSSDPISSQKQLALPSTLGQSSINSASMEGRTLAGYSGDGVQRYATNTATIPANVTMQFGSAQFSSEGQFNDTSQQLQVDTGPSMLVAGSSQQPNFEFQAINPPLQPGGLYDDWSRTHDNRGVDEDFLMEEIRMKSHEIMENEEMQQLLRVFSMGGAASAQEDEFFPPYMPSPSQNYNFEDERSRSSSGKAVVGWLKIKAAMRWGIFIRKKAAERRRAQLVELED